MKYDKRTIEAFRCLNAEMKHMNKYTSAYPFYNQDSQTATHKFIVAKGFGCRRVRMWTVGYYRTEELLRAGVETVAEFLEEVV